MIWGSDNWPVLTLVNGAWGTSYPMPVSTTKTVPAPTGTDYFNGTSLGQEWEFNHNPDTSKFSVNNGVTLSTATVTDDLFTARNTLTHRAIGPKSQATFQFDISKMADGDRAGAVLFRDQSAYIGIHKSGSNAQIVYVNNLTLGSNWVTQSKGSVAATGPSVTGSTVYFRITSDLTPAYGQSPNRASTFRYSLDGTNWTQLGGDFLVNNDWTYFTGYRYSAFNFATKSLGGSVLLKSFNMVNV